MRGGSGCGLSMTAPPGRVVVRLRGGSGCGLSVTESPGRCPPIEAEKAGVIAVTATLSTAVAAKTKNLRGTGAPFVFDVNIYTLNLFARGGPPALSLSSVCFCPHCSTFKQKQR